MRPFCFINNYFNKTSAEKINMLDYMPLIRVFNDRFKTIDPLCISEDDSQRSINRLKLECSIIRSQISIRLVIDKQNHRESSEILFQLCYLKIIVI